ncbi:Fpg/Nei family DNA glycosylase [Streptantibioticus silvisoli]|uniref:Fpg/Nei family DNA glycosylase n=1 Tax=Streptantibioticus silvisoli TaxID=2705255 RepID=UPI0027E285D3|nr:DNA-formamidopyrimidine glycosylase family protein [Streptantibioticus silvisoli]
MRRLPELPDVEGYRRVLRGARGRTIRSVTVRDAGVLRGVSAAGLERGLRGRRFREPYRHGKWLLAPTDGEQVLAFHFGMTGALVLSRSDEPPHPYDRVVLALGDDLELRYRDQRKLKGLRLEDRASARRLVARLGPDAADLTRQDLTAVLEHRRARIKAVLLDQSAVAGLGNLLADEILWRARVHPARRASDLTSAEGDRVLAGTRRVLRTAVRDGRVPPRRSWLTGRRDRVHPDCPRCATPLRHRAVAGRSTYWCPHCQPEP